MLLCIIGLIGCVIPLLPGPPLNLAGLFLVQYVHKPYETQTLIIFGILTTVALFIDYLLPIWFAKKFGATKKGIWGSIIGMFIGVFFTPVGMILGLFLGAVIGDLMSGRTSQQATRSGIAIFLGTLLSVGLKLGVSGLISIFVFYESVFMFI